MCIDQQPVYVTGAIGYCTPHNHLLKKQAILHLAYKYKMSLKPSRFVLN